MLNGQSTFDQSGFAEKVTVLQLEVYFRHDMIYEAHVLKQRLRFSATSKENSPNFKVESLKDLRVD